MTHLTFCAVPIPRATGNLKSKGWLTYFSYYSLFSQCLCEGMNKTRNELSFFCLLISKSNWEIGKQGMTNLKCLVVHYSFSFYVKEWRKWGMRYLFAFLFPRPTGNLEIKGWLTYFSCYLLFPQYWCEGIRKTTNE